MAGGLLARDCGLPNSDSGIPVLAALPGGLPRFIIEVPSHVQVLRLGRRHWPACVPLAWADELPAGKPAGVRQARLTSEDWVVAGGQAAVTIAVIAIAASRNDNATQNQSGPTTGTSTTS
jgi:hypothetical protein